jgi:hypothetical protein
VASLGAAGSVTLTFDDIVVEDGPGPDLIIFENPFFQAPVPQSAEDDFLIFDEPAKVELSADGSEWHAFPYDEAAVADSAGQQINRELYQRLAGTAGITPTFTGNWTEADDPAVFDPDGEGGVSGAGGDAFDLARVGLAEARFVRITDLDTGDGLAAGSAGFDLDAVVVLHGRPIPPADADTDGDRLSDLAERLFYGTDRFVADSDGDGVDDGREVAACRDPNLFDETPWIHREPRIWLAGAECTELRWTFVGTDRLYDVVRGEIAQLGESGGSVDLGSLACLADDEPTVQWLCDPAMPDPGGGYFYLVAVDGQGDLGRSSGLSPRQAAEACP